MPNGQHSECNYELWPVFHIMGYDHLTLFFAVTYPSSSHNTSRNGLHEKLVERSVAVQQTVPDRSVTEVSEQLQVGVIWQLASCSASLQQSDKCCPTRGDE